MLPQGVREIARRYPRRAAKRTGILRPDPDAIAKPRDKATHDIVRHWIYRRPSGDIELAKSYAPVAYRPVKERRILEIETAVHECAPVAYRRLLRDDRRYAATVAAPPHARVEVARPCVRQVVELVPRDVCEVRRYYSRFAVPVAQHGGVERKAEAVVAKARESRPESVGLNSKTHRLKRRLVLLEDEDAGTRLPCRRNENAVHEFSRETFPADDKRRLRLKIRV